MLYNHQYAHERIKVLQREALQRHLVYLLTVCCQRSRLYPLGGWLLARLRASARWRCCPQA